MIYVVDEMLYILFYIVLFRMHKIYILLNAESVELLDRKIKEQQKWTKVALFFYIAANAVKKFLSVYVNVTYYQKFMIEDIIWLLIPLSYIGSFIDLLMLMYFIFLSFSFIDILFIRSSLCKRLLMKLVIYLVSGLIAINIAIPTLIDTMYIYL